MINIKNVLYIKLKNIKHEEYEVYVSQFKMSLVTHKVANIFLQNLKLFFPYWV